ncbi:MAG: hypothetical protein WC444_06150 [Candidatus Paceibacterota bacterium]
MPIPSEILKTEEDIQEIRVQDMILPYKLKDRILFSPGVHNQSIYTGDVIVDSFYNTQWNDRTLSIYLDHKDEFTTDPDTGRKTKHVGAEVSDYAGYVKNLRCDKGHIKGDLHFTDLNTALKVKLGAHFGISPRGDSYMIGNKVKKMLIENWSIVVNPAIKTTYLNFAMCEKTEEEIFTQKIEENNDKENTIKNKSKEPRPITDQKIQIDGSIKKQEEKTMTDETVNKEGNENTSKNEADKIITLGEKVNKLETTMTKVANMMEEELACKKKKLEEETKEKQTIQAQKEEENRKIQEIEAKKQETKEKEMAEKQLKEEIETAKMKEIEELKTQIKLLREAIDKPEIESIKDKGIRGAPFIESDTMSLGDMDEGMLEYLKKEIVI